MGARDKVWENWTVVSLRHSVVVLTEEEVKLDDMTLQIPSQI